jgi:hypothetical protein
VLEQFSAFDTVSDISVSDVWLHAPVSRFRAEVSRRYLVARFYIFASLDK